MFFGSDLGQKVDPDPNWKFPNIIPISDPIFPIVVYKKIVIQVVNMFKKD